MNVFWTSNALARLQEIEDYISADSPKRAADFITKLMNCADTLAAYPEAGRIVPEDEDQLRRELLYKGYRIIYRFDTEVVYILSVFEGSRLVRVEDFK
jgi:plasmid stabilization system protein ParE